jgi:hypothetical protein
MQAQTISSFNPEIGQVGKQVTISGADFYLGPGNQINQVWFGDTPALMFTVTSPSLMFATVPVGAVTGPISVKLPTGPRVYSAEDFTVIGPEPYVTDFTPNSGPGLTDIAIDGLQFPGNVAAVQVNGTNVFFFFVQSDNRITATVQANVTTGPLTVVGIGTGSNTTSELFYVPPVVSGFTPESGRAGETLTINGVNFIDTTQVRIGSVPMPVFNVNGNTQIVATIPPGAISGKVVVVTPGGQYQTTTEFSLLPSISGFSPSTGVAGTPVTISGANLDAAPVSVTFNGVAASLSSVSFNQIVATAPASTSGPIIVTTADGSATAPAVFYYPPSISGFTPGSGGQGTSVSISGTSFTNATLVQFDGDPALVFTVVNNSLIQAAAPNNVSTGPLTVSAPGGVAVSANLFYAPATLTGFLPSEGFAGTDVILFGSNFEGATQVTFNGVSAAILSNTGTQIGTRVPAAATSGPIRVTTPAGTVVSTSPFIVPGTSDLRVNTFLHEPEPVTVETELTLTIVPSNDGPDTASNVTASVTLDAGLAVKSAFSNTPGVTVNTNGNPVIFDIGTMTLFNNPTLTLVLVPQVEGLVTNRVTLSSSTFDPDTGNNTDSRASTVLPVAELAIRRTGSGQVQLAWPASLTGFALQSTATLTNGTPWANVPTPPVIEGDAQVVTEPGTGTTRFYRLRQ